MAGCAPPPPLDPSLAGNAGESPIDLLPLPAPPPTSLAAWPAIVAFPPRGGVNVAGLKEKLARQQDGIQRMLQQQQPLQLPPAQQPNTAMSEQEAEANGELVAAAAATDRAVEGFLAARGSLQAAAAQLAAARLELAARKAAFAEAHDGGPLPPRLSLNCGGVVVSTSRALLQQVRRPHHGAAPLPHCAPHCPRAPSELAPTTLFMTHSPVVPRWCSCARVRGSPRSSAADGRRGWRATVRPTARPRPFGPVPPAYTHIILSAICRSSAGHRLVCAAVCRQRPIVRRPPARPSPAARRPAPGTSCSW